MVSTGGGGGRSIEMASRAELKATERHAKAAPAPPTVGSSTRRKEKGGERLGRWDEGGKEGRRGGRAGRGAFYPGDLSLDLAIIILTCVCLSMAADA